MWVLRLLLIAPIYVNKVIELLSKNPILGGKKRMIIGVISATIKETKDGGTKDVT